MATTPTRRLATLFLVLAVPGLGSLTWLTWQDLENGVRAEAERVLRFEELAGTYVANNLRFEINSIRFLVTSDETSDVLAQYRARARFPRLIESVAVTASPGPFEADLNLDLPVSYIRWPGGRALEVRYSVSELLGTVVPVLVREAFSASGAGPSFEAWVIRRSDEKRPDWVGPLVSRSLDPPPLPDSGRIRQYLPSGYPESPWLLGVRVAPSGLAGYLQAFRIRNLIWAGALFGVLALGAGLFLTSLLRVFGVMRREQAFSTLISHELKTPLAALRSLSENLAEGVVTDKARIREYGGQLIEQTDRLSQMLGRVLSMAGLESSEAVLIREEFDAVALARGMAEPLGIVVESPRLEWVVKGNAAAIRAALDNLLTNAQRYGAKEGEQPVIEVELLAGYQWGRSWVGIAVSDHGPGLTADEQGALFRPYFRGAQAARQQIPGSGVGLRMVWSTMRHLGGRVQVKSVPGGGLCLVLWLREGRQR